jgi:hypothetical protein
MGGACNKHGRGDAYKMLVRKPEGKRKLGRLSPRWEDNIRMDLKEIDLKVVDWIYLAQGKEQWR